MVFSMMSGRSYFFYFFFAGVCKILAYENNYKEQPLSGDNPIITSNVFLKDSLVLKWQTIHKIEIDALKKAPHIRSKQIF